MAKAAPGDDTLTIDELAAASRVPSRTIRFYQSRGALQTPEIRGRVAYYGKHHVERLKLIAQLSDRGLRIDAIGDLMKRIDRGEVDLAEWLGVEQEMQAPWGADQPRTVTEAELYDIVGSRRPGLLADLTRAEIVERKGDVYLVGSPALLAIAIKLETVGIDLE
ncbi:MAG TPA: MerR family transcriptional regulator, partial [Kofleriaceae bacterium]|nr:MerR family transcriptional regulator [Kofleriaceae bacterium]